MSNKIYKTSGQKRFGLFSVIALVAGIVIGSGIFQKNESIVEGVGNQMDAIYAWVAGTVLVLSTVLAFIEIFSISNKSKKPGTLFYWSKNLIGPRTGKILAIIAVFIYVSMSIAALPIWASNKMYSATSVNIDSIGQWGYFFTTWGTSFAFLAIIYGIVIMSKSKQKFVSNVGMGVKLVPLIFVIIGGIVFVSIGQGQGITSDSIPGTGEGNYEGNSFLNILSVMPAILFTFNGFITSSSIMNESKSPKTYKAGYLGGMVLVSVIYIMFTVSIFFTGSTGLEGAIMEIVGEKHGKWVYAIMQGAVVVSMLSGMMGTAAAGPKHYANMSADGLFRDKEGKLLKRNREMMPQFAAWQLLGIALFYQFVFQSLDMIAIGTGAEFASGQYMIALNFATDFAAIFVFFAYAIIIAAALINRKTKKVEVDKSILFIPSAIIAISGIFSVMGFQLYDTINTLIKSGNWVDIIVLSILLVSPFIILKYNEIQTSKMTEMEWIAKKKAVKQYDSMIVDSIFVEKANPFVFR